MDESPGRRREAKEIAELLLSSDSLSLHVLVFPILGAHGSGKTSLVRLVCLNKRVQVHFPLIIWVDISRVHSGKEILWQVINKLDSSNDNYRDLAEEEIVSIFELRCKKSKCLFVLEDLLSKEDGGEWFDLLKPLMCVLAKCNPGSRILATSRFASHLFVQLPMPKGMPYFLEPLHHDESLAFFKSIAFKGVAEEDKKSIALEIFETCANNPRVINTGASILSLDLPLNGSTSMKFCTAYKIL